MLLEQAKKIKTFTEGTDPDSSDISAIREHITRAEKVVYIGFAFHRLNLELLVPKRIKGVRFDEVKCYASTYNISSSDKQVIEQQIEELYQKEVVVQMADLKCNEFFSEFWRSLAF